MRTLFPRATNAGLTNPHGPWDSESSLDKLDDASSVYFDAEEFPRIDASPSEAVSCDTQLDAYISRQLKDEPVEDFAADTFNLEKRMLDLPQCPNCDIGDCSGVFASVQELDSDFEGTKNTASFEATPVISESWSNGTGNRAMRKLQRKLKIDKIWPEKTRNRPEITEEKTFWGKWRKMSSKIAL